MMQQEPAVPLRLNGGSSFCPPKQCELRRYNIHHPPEEGIPTLITWSSGGSSVAVEGSWDNWRARFIVDGETRHAPDLPCDTDEKGQAFNLLDVQSYVAENVENVSEFEVPGSPECSYGQGLPRDEDYAKEAMTVPVQLEAAGLVSSWEGKAPQHVVLNHVFVEKGESVVALGLTHRFQSKKVVGKGEAGAATSQYAFGPVEDNIIIKYRLLTRTTTTRGEPPLKKLQKKFSSFVAEIEKESAAAAAADSSNYGECERLGKAVIQELNSFEIPLLKSRAVMEANVREKENFNELKDEINRQMVQAQRDIEDLKKQLEESKIERQHKEECEAIRKLIAMQPPRLETQQSIGELEREIAILDGENTASSATLDLRKKQFALLLHVVEELQSTLEEDQKTDPPSNAVEPPEPMALDD
ncbi:hypothetical protein M569_01330 [Genlisea aurea]|uniref:Association with the SNF1 complex (ASC) domain-containing protein n=1 Tax=Genlisea aurea TaxID=192259 RepID=S8D7M2_9LAMI|nr:hypothetical protein M569_01330 [Genlisea aurea]